MAIMPTRRRYRKVFRRVRFYLPAVVVLLGAMVMFLPLSAGWMGRRAEREIKKRLGVDVRIERLEVTLAAAEMEAIGVTLSGRAGEAPFRLERVKMEGALGSLLAGDEKWPSLVTIEGVTPVLLERNQEGLYELRGGFRTLLEQVEVVLAKPAVTKPGGNGGTSGGPKGGSTPRVVIRNLPISIDPLRADLPSVVITMDEIALAERFTKASPFRVSLGGIAMADSLENFSLQAVCFPEEKRLAVDGDLSGVALPFEIPTLGPFIGRVKDLTIDFNGGEFGGNLRGSLQATAGFFEVAQSEPGGARWEDEPLVIRLQCEYSPSTRELHVGQLALSSAEVGAALSGSVRLEGELPGEVKLRVDRLPKGALALARTELTDRLGLVVSAVDTSQTLELDAQARGPFSRPRELDSHLGVRLGGWSISTPALQEPLILRNLDATVSNSEARVRDLAFEIGGMRFFVKGAAPVNGAGGEAEGAVMLTGEGDAEAVFDMLARRGVLPAEFSYLRAPISLEATLPVVVTRGAVRPEVVARPEEASGSLAWKSGELGLKSMPDPIRLEPGAIVYKDRQFNLQRIMAQTRQVTIKADGKVGGIGPGMKGEAIAFSGTVVSTGEMDDLVYLLGRHVRLPNLPRDIAGDYQLEVSADGSTANPAAINYQARLLVDKGSALVDTPSKQVQVTAFSTDITLDRDTLMIRRGAFVMPDKELGDTQVEFSVAVGRATAKADVRVHTRLEVLPGLLPKDLKDMYMVGPLPVSGWATLTPREPLPAELDVTRGWLALLGKEGVTVGIEEGDDLRADFEFVNGQEGPVEFFPREFPVRISNIRGTARFTPQGIIMKSMLADVGSAKDIEFDGSVRLGRPVRITFTAGVKALDLNEWTDGWGEREWASYSASFEPRWKSIPDPYQMAVVDGSIKTESLKFMTYTGANFAGDLHFESWSRIPNTMTIRNLKGELYKGRGNGELDFQFPDGERGIMKCTARFDKCDLNGFMNDLYERPQSMDGVITGDLEFDGQLLNYPTYRGNARYEIERSSVVGTVFLQYLREVFQFSSTTGGRDTRLHGTVRMFDEKVFFPDLVILNPGINLTADGHVDFRGRLFFDVTASVIAKRLQEIPFIRLIGNVVDLVGNQIVSYQVRGTLKEPTYSPVFTPMARLETMREAMKESLIPRQEPPR